MSFNIGAGPGVWAEEDAAAGGSRCGYESARPLHNLSLLAEDAQLEAKRRNKGDPNQSSTRKALRARRANDSSPPLLSGLKWGNRGRR
jgi:hypothetical protein